MPGTSVMNKLWTRALNFMEKLSSSATMVTPSPKVLSIVCWAERTIGRKNVKQTKQILMLFMEF
jgi:hypothetical protein